MRAPKNKPIAPPIKMAAILIIVPIICSYPFARVGD
jgi:hypothetical protein